MELPNGDLKKEIDNGHKELEIQTDLNDNLNKILDEKNSKIEELNKFFIQLKQIQDKEEKEEPNEEDTINQIENLDELISSHRDQSEEIDSLYKIISQCKDALLNLQSEKEKTNDLQNDNAQYKLINNQLLQKNEELKNQLESINTNRIEKDQDAIDEVDSLKTQVQELKKLVLEKEEEIEALRKENKDSAHTNNELHNSTDTSIANINSMPIPEIEKKLKKYKSEIKKRDMDLESERQQSALLKTQIKELNNEIKNIQSFDNKINSYDEYTNLFKIAFENYKPKKKEQEEAYAKLKEHLAGYVEEESTKEKKKRGIFGFK